MPQGRSRSVSILCLAVAVAGLLGCPADEGRAADSGAPTGIGGGTDTTTGGGPGSTGNDPNSTTGSMTVTSSGTASDPDESGTAASVFDVAMGTDTAGDCVPTADVEMTCDEIDDDCNGLVDDVDEGLDGICDCLAIALVGVPGSNDASQFEQWLVERGTSTERVNPALVTAETLAPYDIIIIDGLTRTYSPLEAAEFEAWVTNGGGLMAMTGHTADPTVAQVWPNSILERFELSYVGALLSGPVTDFEVHPTTAGLTSVTFLGGFAVTEAVAGSSDVIGRLTDATPVARARAFGSGKVFVWGDEWIEFDSEWSAMPEIALLWANVLTWLSPANVCAPPRG